tara:strand:+ start:1640 stop:2017 length:378 start_codon:yes stop_codon:yes gene_type:complete
MGASAVGDGNSVLGIRLGTLPAPVVDAMFVALVSEADRFHGPCVRAAVVASFASARVEAEIMEDADISPRDRLKAAQQLRDGFTQACKLVSGTSHPPIPLGATRSGASSTPLVPEALEEMYGNEG